MHKVSQRREQDLNQVKTLYGVLEEAVKRCDVFNDVQRVASGLHSAESFALSSENLPSSKENLLKDLEMQKIHV